MPLTKSPPTKYDVLLPAWKCRRCAYEWPTKGQARPRRCSKCKSFYWWNPPRDKNQSPPSE